MFVSEIKQIRALAAIKSSMLITVQDSLRGQRQLGDSSYGQTL